MGKYHRSTKPATGGDKNMATKTKSVSENQDPPVGCSELLGALNAKVKNFDMEMWKEQDSSCVLCNCPMHLEFGHEWPDDPRMLLCWSCMADVCGELMAKLETPN